VHKQNFQLFFFGLHVAKYRQKKIKKIPNDVSLRSININWQEVVTLFQTT